MHGFTNNNKAVPLYCISIIIKIIDLSTRWGARVAGCKILRYSNRAVCNSNKAHRAVKIVYEANKDSET